MANSKISALTSATTPLAGTEVMPIVQGGATVKATVANVTGAGTYPGSFTSLAYTTTLTGGTGIVALGTNQFYKDASGNVGIGTSSPSSLLHLMVTTNAASGPTQKFQLNDTGSSIAVGQNLGDLQFIGNDAQGSGIRAQIIAITEGTSGDTGLSFLTSAATVAAVENLRISSVGNVTVNTGNVIQGTAAKGINFTANTPAAGMTSQLLNWYEEGTWTPTQGAGLTVVGTFTSSGRYTRVGRLVTVTATLKGSTSIACAAGAAFTTGLPYTPSGGNSSGSAANSNALGTVLLIGSTTYSVSAMAAAAEIYMSATYSV